MLAAMAPNSPTAVIPAARTNNSALQKIILRSRMFRAFLLGRGSAKRRLAKVEPNSFLLALRSIVWPVPGLPRRAAFSFRSEEHTSELQSLMRYSYAVFCLKKKTTIEHTLTH